MQFSLSQNCKTRVVAGCSGGQQLRKWSRVWEYGWHGKLMTSTPGEPPRSSRIEERRRQTNWNLHDRVGNATVMVSILVQWPLDTQWRGKRCFVEEVIKQPLEIGLTIVRSRRTCTISSTEPVDFTCYPLVSSLGRFLIDAE